MATPSSSATSPSPPMAYLSHAPSSAPLAASTSSDFLERDQRKKAVQKFLARAEVSMVTRALRTRLSYASYKATHNIPHIPLRDLEAQTQSQSQSASFTRTIAAKRKAVGAPNHNQLGQGHNGIGAGATTTRRGGSGTMAPPSTISPPRVHYLSANGSTSVTGSNSELASSSKLVPHAPSLYASILAPPSANQARTIHNASDPPVSAPSRPAPSPRSRAPKTTPRNAADSSRPLGKGRKDKVAKAAASPERKKNKRASIEKGKKKQASDIGMDVDGDVDLKAAATLTNLFRSNRPSVTGSASSPRSSIDDSEAGSTYSYSHFAQSSARTTSTGNAPTSAPSVASLPPHPDAASRHRTPPPSVKAQQTTPRPAPSDNEAADLMLYLATSPSPARPSKDKETYRALGGGTGPLRSKGRILFPTASEPSGADDPASIASTQSSSALIRGEDSFDSISSIGTALGGRQTESLTRATSSSGSTLLPPAILPPSFGMISPSLLENNPSPKPIQSQGSAEFNFSDFINASPSPTRGNTHQSHKSNLGLRADVGRKLFEEEQMRHAIQVSQDAGKRQDEKILGAGIDLVPS